MSDEERLQALEAAIDGLVSRLERIERRLGAAEEPARPAPAAVAPPQPPPPRAPTPPPPPPQPVEPAPARPKIDLEDLLGGRVLAWAGGAAIVLGVVFFLAMAVNRGWIDEPTRIVLAFLGSTALLAGGVYLYEAKGQTDAAVAAVAASIAALYASLTTGTQVYDLISPPVGLGVAALVGAVATAIAVRWAKRGIAALGILGALLSPVLVDAGTSGASLAFMALALLSATGVLIWQRWDWLAVGAYVISAPQLLLWVYDTGEPLAVQLVALALFWATYVAAAIGYELRVPTERLRPSSGGLLVGNALLIAGAGWYALDDAGHSTGATVWVMSVALAHIVLGGASFRGRMSREIALVLLAVAIGLTAVAFALALDGPALVAAWCAEAVLLTWLGRRTEHLRSYIAGGVFLVLAIFHVLLFDADPDLVREPRADWTPTVAVALVVIAAAAIRYLYAGPWPEPGIAAELVAAAGLAYIPPLAFEGVTVALLWSALAVGAAAYAARLGGPHRVGGVLALLTLPAVHALAFEAPPDGLRTGVDDLGVAALAVGAVAAAALAAGYLARAETDLARVVNAVGAVALVYLPSLAIVDVTSTGDSFEPGQTPQVLLSAFWALTGLAAIVYGLMRDDKPVRMAGLALLGLAVAKVVLYDLSNLDSGYRALSLIPVGLLLLAGAYAYQRMRVATKEVE